MGRDLGGAIVDRASTGDATAFARLVAAHHEAMVRVGYVVTGDADLANDAAQSAWAIAWRKLGTVRDPDRVRPWLMAVTANEGRQLLRRRGRRSVVELDVVADMTAPPRGGRGDPANEIDAIDLGNALARLKPADRVFVGLRYSAGMTSDEIGAALGMTGGGVRARLGRILDLLRKDLSDG